MQKQESIPIRCVLPTCADHTCFNSHQMSALVEGGPEVTWLNRSPVMATRCHQRGCFLSSEVPCSEGVGWARAMGEGVHVQ